MDMDKRYICDRLRRDKITLDDFRGLVYDAHKETVADVLVELAYALYVECGCDEHKANRALLGCLVERWWDDLDDNEEV